MTASTIAVRDYTLGTAKDVKSTDNSSVHTPHHNVDEMTLALPANMLNGTAYLTDTTMTDLLAAPATSPDVRRNHVCAVQVANKGGTAALVGIYDGSPSPDVAMAWVYVPNGNTVAVVYPIPLRATAGNAVRVAADASSTIYVSAQGYIAE